MKAARDGRYGHRHATMILIAYRHELRASELCELEWAQIEWGRNASLHVRRAKNGKPAVHPLRGDEIRALRELRRQSDGRFVFQTERGGHYGRDQPPAKANLPSRQASRPGTWPSVSFAEGSERLGRLLLSGRNILAKFCQDAE
jgi:integrase